MKLSLNHLQIITKPKPNKLPNLATNRRHYSFRERNKHTLVIKWERIQWNTWIFRGKGFKYGTWLFLLLHLALLSTPEV